MAARGDKQRMPFRKLEPDAAHALLCLQFEAEVVYCIYFLYISNVCRIYFYFKNILYICVLYILYIYIYRYVEYIFV